MLFTNDRAHGGSFKTQFVRRLKSADSLTIASGYFGANLVKELTPELVAVAKRGRCRILFGMVFHDGVTAAQSEVLKTLDNKLRAFSSNSGVYISIKPYHGKIYQIDSDIFLGSSNFSVEGFKTRWEAIATVYDSGVKKATRSYLDFLFSQKTTVNLDQVQLDKKVRTAPQTPSSLLDAYKINTPLPGTVVGEMKIKLRVDDQPSSSLNLCFEPGRKTGGVYKPRPWYEIEITAQASEIRNPLYPVSVPIKGGKSRTGDFNAFIYENGKLFKLKMKVCSAYGKALMSSGDVGGRETLGRYIKGKLERAGVLQHGEQITSDTLAAYGRDYITLQKIDDKNYILAF